MSDAVTVVADHPNWQPSERALYASALVRVMGETDTKGSLLVEFMSGPLANERRWLKPEELVRDEIEPEPDGEGAGA